MKAYTIASPGIRVTQDGIPIGESGRSRTLVNVPLPPESVIVDSQVTDCAGSVTAALVYIPDQSGFRGGWHLRDARPQEEWDRIVTGCDCPNTLGGQAHVPNCPVIIPEQPHQAEVIAEGMCAQGDAGRMGGGPEYLIILEHGQSVEIVRSGRLYGKPGVIRLDCVAGCIVASVPREDAAERKAAGKWDAITASAGEPTEMVLSWGGGTSRTRQEEDGKMPVLRDAAGQYHSFCGDTILGIVTVLEDVSVTGGYASSRCSAYRVALHPGVSYIGLVMP